MGLGVSGEGSNPSFCANTPETCLFPGCFSAFWDFLEEKIHNNEQRKTKIL
jgi:hypothetical protein